MSEIKMAPIHVLQSDKVTLVPMTKITCPRCHHEIAISEELVHYRYHYEQVRKMFARLSMENTDLKKANKYLQEELKQFRKAAATL